jgi:uncharacterized protein YjbI with pentapeptide repeats
MFAINLFVFVFIVVFLISRPYQTAHPAEFGEGVLIEAHGLIFDLLVIGVFGTLFNKFNERRREQQRQADQRNLTIQRYQEEIDDYRPGRSEENILRITGIIRRLNRLGISNINLNHTFLQAANLADANLAGAKLWVANLRGASLRGATLNGADLHYANLRGGNLRAADLRGANLGGTNLEYCTYNDATRWPDGFSPPDSAINVDRLQGADLREANLTAANLDYADLTGANLIDTNLSRADLTRADLTRADLTRATLIGVNLRSANLRGADVREADLRGAMLENAILRKIIYNSETQWPDGYEPPASARAIDR